ncbi:MAG: hypothetical protein ABIH34_01570 [Nanoarchaeota archaeon]
MIQTKDFASFVVGVVLTAFGALPLLSKFNKGPAWFELKFLPIEIFAFILAIGGAYLVMNSIIEITNSNPVGKTSFIIAVLVFIIGLFQVLARFNIGPDWFALSFISHTIYYVLFVIEGVFLMIAMFAMEL